MKMPELVRGDKLTDAQRKEVLARFVYRNLEKDTVRDKETRDRDWLRAHAFYVRADGRIADKPGHCEPAYMAGE